MMQSKIFTDLDLPDLFLADDNHPEIISLPTGFDEMPISSSPQYTLYRLLRYLKPACVLEIGTQCGYSALIMALAFRDNGMKVDITCVDPFLPTGDNDGLSTFTYWYNTIYKSGFKLGIQLLLSASETILPHINKQFDFIFIDGSHEYEHVRQDCLLSLKLLKEGGYFIVHDYVIYPSVKKGADEVIDMFDLPFFVNNIQKNDRGDLCGWVIARKTNEPDESVLSTSLQYGHSLLASKYLTKTPLGHIKELISRIFRR